VLLLHLLKHASHFGVSEISLDVALNFIHFDCLGCWFERLLLLSGFLPLFHEVELLISEFGYLDALHLLVSRQISTNQVRVVAQESQQHDGDDKTEEDRDCKELIPIVEVL